MNKIDKKPVCCPETDTDINTSESKGSEIPPRGTAKDNLKSFSTLDYIDPAILKVAPRNARTHSAKQIKQIAKSIEQFGFNNPVLIDDDNQIVAGHGRYAAALKLNMRPIPILRLSHLSKDELRAYTIADNRLAELAGWDQELLAIEFKELSELELHFDLELTGFSVAEIDSYLDLDVTEQDRPDEADHFDDVDHDGAARCKAGELWQLGKHLLYVGDALDIASYERLMGGNKATMIFTDPPYNVPIEGHVMGKGKVKHQDFKMAAGEMSEEEFTGFLKTVFGHMANFSKDGSIHYICMDWRHLHEITIAGRSHYTELKNLCVWNKDNGGMGSFYRSKHELVFVYKNGTKSHINNFELGQMGRYRTNVWNYGGINSFSKDRMAELAMHPTVKPVKLVSDAILDCSKRGDIILDPFAGSGTTLIAAEKTGRQARCIELDPKYADVILKRWTDLGHGEAQLL